MVKFPSQVFNVVHALPCASLEVSPLKSLHGILIDKLGKCSKGGQKLVIFNLNGTLCDGSLLASSNPNSKICPSTKTNCRRVLFRS